MIRICIDGNPFLHCREDRPGALEHMRHILSMLVSGKVAADKVELRKLRDSLFAGPEPAHAEPKRAKLSHAPQPPAEPPKAPPVHEPAVSSKHAVSQFASFDKFMGDAP